MKKKIYYKDKHIEFSEEMAVAGVDPGREVIELRGKNDAVLKRVIQNFLSPERTTNYLVLSHDIKKSIEEIRTHFKYIEAGGGFIERGDRFLLIYRNNRWDLPKGKREKNESPEDCAVRECEEECGVRDLEIKRKLASTWHVYEHKGGFALKRTFWYYMSTNYGGALTPQLDEGISEARWMTREEIASEALTNTYYTISDVVKDALKPNY